MSVTSGFFNSLNGDRKYNATSIAKLFDGLINDGIYMTVGETMLVKASSGMNVVVKPGRAWFNHTWTLNDSDLLLTLDPAELLLNRIDAIILEVNSQESQRANSIKILKGEAAETAVRPTLTNTEEVHQYALAYIAVAPKITTITQADITNMVGTADTPYVNAIVKTIDTSALYAQFTDEFNAWFDSMKDAVSDNAVMELSIKIADLTKTDNSVPTLLYRYVLFPDTLTESEKTSIESNTALMTLATSYKDTVTQIGDIIWEDRRKLAVNPKLRTKNGFIAASGGQIMASDYPEYAAAIQDGRYKIRASRATSFAGYPWYYNPKGTNVPYARYDDAEDHPNGFYFGLGVTMHATCNGYTVLFTPGYTSAESGFTQYQSGASERGLCQVFNPKGTRIFKSTFGFSENFWVGYIHQKPGNVSASYYSPNIYFEDPNTVLIIINGMNTSGYCTTACARLIINGDTVTMDTPKNTTNRYCSNMSFAHIPNTDYAIGAVISSQSSLSGTNYTNGSTGYNLHTMLIKETDATTSWSNSIFTNITLPERSKVDQQRRYHPFNSIMKYTTAGLFIVTTKGYVKINYGSNGSSTFGDGNDHTAKDTAPEGDLLDICAKKGDWIPCETKNAIYNIKTNELKDTSQYGTFIGTMYFARANSSDPTIPVDLYVRTVANKPVLAGLDSNTEEVLFENMELADIPAYGYLSPGETKFSAKNFIIIGNKLFIQYPVLVTTDSSYVAIENQHPYYYMFNYDRIQLPNVIIDDGIHTRALVRVK